MTRQLTPLLIDLNPTAPVVQNNQSFKAQINQATALSKFKSTYNRHDTRPLQILCDANNNKHIIEHAILEKRLDIALYLLDEFPEIRSDLGSRTRNGIMLISLLAEAVEQYAPHINLEEYTSKVDPRYRFKLADFVHIINRGLSRYFDILSTHVSMMINKPRSQLFAEISKVYVNHPLNCPKHCCIINTPLTPEKRQSILAGQHRIFELVQATAPRARYNRALHAKFALMGKNYNECYYQHLKMAAEYNLISTVTTPLFHHLYRTYAQTPINSFYLTTKQQLYDFLHPEAKKTSKLATQIAISVLSRTKDISTLLRILKYRAYEFNAILSLTASPVKYTIDLDQEFLLNHAKSLVTTMTLENWSELRQFLSEGISLSHLRIEIVSPYFHTDINIDRYNRIYEGEKTLTCLDDFTYIQHITRAYSDSQWAWLKAALTAMHTMLRRKQNDIVKNPHHSRYTQPKRIPLTHAGEDFLRKKSTFTQAKFKEWYQNDHSSLLFLCRLLTHPSLEMFATTHVVAQSLLLFSSTVFTFMQWHILMQGMPSKLNLRQLPGEHTKPMLVRISDKNPRSGEWCRRDYNSIKENDAISIHILDYFLFDALLQTHFNSLPQGKSIHQHIHIWATCLLLCGYLSPEALNATTTRFNEIKATLEQNKHPLLHAIQINFHIANKLLQTHERLQGTMEHIALMKNHLETLKLNLTNNKRQKTARQSPTSDIVQANNISTLESGLALRKRTYITTLSWRVFSSLNQEKKGLLLLHHLIMSKRVYGCALNITRRGVTSYLEAKDLCQLSLIRRGTTLNQPRQNSVNAPPLKRMRTLN